LIFNSASASVLKLWVIESSQDGELQEEIVANAAVFGRAAL
jgi:hypothetical protein